MSEDEQKQAQEAALASLDMIQLTTTLADLAASMRDALVAKEFASPVAEQAGIHFMWTAFGMSQQNGKATK